MSTRITDLRFPGSTSGTSASKGSRGDIAVPQFVGMPKDKAVRSIQDLGLVEDVETVVTVGTEDEVFEQKPERGARVARGATVVLGVIKNPRPQSGVGERLQSIDDNLAKLTEKVDTKLDAIHALAQRIDEKVTRSNAGADGKDTGVDGEDRGADGGDGGADGKDGGSAKPGNVGKAAESGGKAGAS